MKHYTITPLAKASQEAGLTPMEMLRALFSLGVNLDNWLFLSTSGVHGHYATVDDVLWEIANPKEALAKNAGEPFVPTITVLAFQPRRIAVVYGTIEVTQEEVLWLRERARETQQVISELPT